MTRIHNTTSVRCTAITAMSVAMLMTSCFTPRKAEQRRCGKADRLMAKAAWLCPDVLLRDSARLQLPADSATWRLAWNDSVDHAGLLNACDSLRAALEALKLESSQSDHQDLVPNAHLHPRVRQAVQSVQRNACKWRAFSDTINGVVVSVRPAADGTPLLTVEQLARTVKAPCPPAPQRPPCPGPLDQLMDRAEEAGWKLLLWAILACVVFYLFRRFVSPLNNMPR